MCNSKVLSCDSDTLFSKARESGKEREVWVLGEGTYPVSYTKKNHCHYKDIS